MSQERGRLRAVSLHLEGPACAELAKVVSGSSTGHDMMRHLHGPDTLTCHCACRSTRASAAYRSAGADALRSSLSYHHLLVLDAPREFFAHV